MQEIPESVQAMVNSTHWEQRKSVETQRRKLVKSYPGVEF